VSTPDQHLETQLLDLREMARQRGYEVKGARMGRDWPVGKSDILTLRFTE